MIPFCVAFTGDFYKFIHKEWVHEYCCITIYCAVRAESDHRCDPEGKFRPPRMPMGAAELGAFLYGVELKYNPRDPSWLNRDRFVLSAGHGSMFLYALLHMAGFDLSLDDIKAFRQVGSKCPGHPEYGVTPGVETTTGPLGQGIANAVGMAIAERKMAAHFNKPGQNIIDHRIFVAAGDGCLMEGVASEACSLAGHLGLGNLIVYYDSNHISIDGSTDIAFTEDVGKRFEAYGWQVLRGSMYSFEDLAALTALAKAETARPSLIILESVIGKGSPSKQARAASTVLRWAKKKRARPRKRSVFRSMSPSGWRRRPIPTLRSTERHSNRSIRHGRCASRPGRRRIRNLPASSPCGSAARRCTNWICLLLKWARK